MRSTRIIWSAALLCAAAAAPADAQSVRYLKFTPAVIPSGATLPLLIQVEVNGQPTRVTLDFSPAGAIPSVIELRDDGSAGDRVAGDGTYTAEVPVAPIQNARTADDVNRVFIGFLNLFSGSANVFRGNMFVDGYSADAGTYPIVRPGQFTQATTRLVNIHDPGYFLTSNPSRVTQEFYRWFGDDYDVINLIYEPQRFANRTHSIIKNTVQGIGRTLTDGSAGFGSAGRLQGISQFPIPGFFDGAETGHIHEFGHQWINFLNASPYASGVPHWPKSTMATGVMGFSIGGQGGQGGSFRCEIVEQSNGTLRLNPATGAPAYNDLDLYLMGLMPASEVRTQIVFADQNAVAQLSCSGQIFSGPLTRVGADDVVRQFGLRVPAYGDAPNRFRVATILVTRDELATPETMWLYSWMVDRAELKTRVPTHSGFTKEIGQPFFVATGGRGSLDMRLDFAGAPADFALVPTPGVQTVATGASAEFAIAVEPRGTGFPAGVTLGCGTLPSGFSCAFSQATVTPGPDGATVMLTIATRPAAEPEIAQAVVMVVALGLCVVAARFGRGYPRRRAVAWATAGLLVALVSGPACGGSPRPPQDQPQPQPEPQPGPSPSAPLVTHTVIVTGTSGAVQHSTAVTVGVK